MQFIPHYDNGTNAVFPPCKVSYFPSDGGNPVCINEEKWGAHNGRQFKLFTDTFATASSYGILKMIDSSGKYFATFKVSQDGIEVMGYSLPEGQVPQILKPSTKNNSYFAWIELGNFFGR